MLISLQYLVQKYNLHITGVLHVGAHQCEEQIFYDAVGIPVQNVWWIDGNEFLVKEMQEKRPDLNIIHALITDQDNTIVPFYLANNGQSSSVYRMHLHKLMAPHVQEIGVTQCKTTRLDTLMKNQIPNSKCLNFLNMDLQGAELLALRSLGSYITQFDYIYLEVNLVELYKGCPLKDELCKYLQNYNFIEMETKLDNPTFGDTFFMRSQNAKMSLK